MKKFLSHIFLLALFLANRSHSSESLSDFATAHYYEGVEYEKAMKYAGQDYSQLIEMLYDEQHKAHWGTIVSVLAMIGDQDAEQHLIKFIERPVDKDDQQAVGQASQAIKSLGYFVNRNKSDAALKYLIEGATKNPWRARLHRSMTSAPGWRDFNEEIFTNSAAVGLVISGTEESLAALQQIRRDTLRGSKSLSAATTKTLSVEDLDFFIEEASSIVTSSIKEHYRARQQHYDHPEKQDEPELMKARIIHPGANKNNGVTLPSPPIK